jgi:deazaflavin-dependent oxidoreductase (nitroreductase family)
VLPTVPLLHLRDGERVVVIASNFGQRRHPAWALNLEAAGTAVVEVPGQGPREMIFRRASPQEFGTYWDEALRSWPGYDGYRRRSGREIRMFVLEPAAAGRP